MQPNEWDVSGRFPSGTSPGTSCPLPRRPDAGSAAAAGDGSPRWDACRRDRRLSGTGRGLVAGLLVAVAAAVADAAPAVVETEPLPAAAQRARFRLPPGFEIQLVACEPTIQKPMNMAFDARGRLWVTHSVEYPWAAAEGAAARDGLTVLEDFGPDGRARRATRFADGLNVPIGVLPLPEGNAAIVWSIPHIWRLSDDDGDGRADQREILYGPFGCEDTHGNQNAFRLGADGWIYANHGFKNRSAVRLRAAGPVVLELKSGNGYRFRPDGSAIEQVTWGEINPFGMDFDSLGNRFNADCHSSPLTMLLRGGRYPSPFGPRNDDYDDGLGTAPATTADDHGSTGIAAVAICDNDRFPVECRGTAFVGNVVTNVVHRDRIVWRGSSPWVERPEEFLTCDDQWFRPVDLAFGPDGCLYVADFYNCIIGHYEVDLKHPRRDRERGRIWRIVHAPGGVAEAADLPRLSTADLASRLAAADETVRRLACEQLVTRGRGDPAVAAELRAAATSADRRARGLSALGRLGLLTEADVAAARRDESRVVRVQLARSMEGWDGQDSVWEATLDASLADPDPFVRRAAAECLVARPSLAAVPRLLATLAAAPAEDRQLLHAVRMAIAAALQRADGASLAALPVDETMRPLLLEVAAGLPGPHVARYALELAATCRPPLDVVERVCRIVARHGAADDLDAAVACGRAASGSDPDRAAAVLDALLQGSRQGGRKVTADGGLGDWGRWLVAAIPGDQPRSDRCIRVAVAFARELSLADGLPLALAVVADATRPAAVRGEAAAAALALDRDRAVPVIAARLSDPAEPAALRVACAGRLADVDHAAAREAIAAALTSAPAAEQRELALAAVTGGEAAEALLGLVAGGRVSARLLQDPQIARRILDAAVADAEIRIRALTAGLPAADERLREVIQRVSRRGAEGEGSAEAGAAVFARHCAACHRFGGSGGLVGPQLEGIGQRGTERLLEDILDPNRNVDAAFRTTVLTLADGRVLSGLALRGDGAEHVLVDAGGREFRVPREEVEGTTVVPLSPMPSNMLDQLDDVALADLIAHLRPGGTPAP